MRQLLSVISACFAFAAAEAAACSDLTDIIEAVPQESEVATYQTELSACLEVRLKDIAPSEQQATLNDILEFAAIWGNPYAVSTMLERGADPDGNLALTGQVPLQGATHYGHHAAMIVLLGFGADPNAGVFDVPVLIALRRLDPVALELLLDAGGDLDVAEGAPEGWTLFDEVLFQNEGGGDVVRLMLAHGVDPMQPMYDGYMPIHVAARLGNVEIVRALVEGGVPVDTLNAQGQTPLERAAGDRWGLAMVALLLELGADPAANRGAAPAEALLDRRDDIFAYMALRGQPQRQQRVLDQALTDAALSVQRHRVAALVEMGADPNWAIGPEHILNRVDCQPEVGRQLMALGADPDLAQTRGVVPDWVTACAGFGEVERAYLAELGYPDLP